RKTSIAAARCTTTGSPRTSAARATSSTRSWCASWPRGAPRPWVSDPSAAASTPNAFLLARVPRVLRVSRRRRVAAWALALLFAAGPAAADLGKLEVSADYDAEFARAADLLEENKRAEGEAILETIRKSAQRPAWDARVALLLAADDAR